MKTIKENDILICKRILAFYKVLKRTTHQVTLQKLKTKQISFNNDTWDSKNVPTNEHDNLKPFKRKMQTWRDGEETTKSELSYTCYIWDGKPVTANHLD